ncbi:MAG: coniferyl aldehyde dehydrogenase [Robiginitomaculum sp.]
MAVQKNNPAERTAIFSVMRELVTADNTLSYEKRIELLKALRKGIIARKAALITAVNEDFNGRSSHETILTDIIPTIGIIDYTIKRLRKWMRPQKKHVAMHFTPAKNRVELQPKGIVLIISPWNYPVSLSILPMATALAAGNRVILKPSEFTPHTSEVLAQLVSDALPSDRATVLTGGADVSIELCKLPFDHILFTGSTNVGRAVMRSAAENLTPVTLELGGKSPTVVHTNYNMFNAAERIARGKFINAGQTCVAPDYAMIPRDKVKEFVSQYEKIIARFYPKLTDNSDYSSIINERHFKRLTSLLDDAQNKGAAVLAVGPDKLQSSGSRKLHPHVVLDVTDEMDLVKEEIFGPILPIIPYDSIEQACEYINQRPRPLAIYYFDKDKSRVASFLKKTISGGAAVNDTLMQFAQDDLPFGGIGPSGMGVCHGYEGFKEFSHAKSVFYQSQMNGGAMLYPPYGKLFDRVTGFLSR